MNYHYTISFRIAINSCIKKRKRAALQKFLFLLLIFIPAVFGQQNPMQSIMDINNFTLWVRDDGFHDWVINTDYCSTFPKGTTGPIFTEGIVWGGKVYDGNDGPDDRPLSQAIVPILAKRTPSWEKEDRGPFFSLIVIFYAGFVRISKSAIWGTGNVYRRKSWRA